ncbi:MAG: ATP-grasp domain-containing protein, partial [Leptospira sp.]|nr:ATP-grasp domain-containing protein [Leptospira sp.]
MAKIWRLNSLFEYELGAYPDQPVFNKSILRRNSSIEKLFFLIADPEDFVVTTDPLAESTKEYFGKEEIQLGKEINHLENIPDGKLVEWGQTSIVSDSKMKPDPSIIEQSKFLNSKATQAKFKQNTGISPFRIGVGKSINDIENFSINIDNPFVLKQAFNFAGRGQVVVRNSSDLKKIKNLATWTGRDPFVMEEWQESRNSDFSGLF